MWIGLHTTLEKKAYAALRMIELAKYLGSKATHYREEDAYESDLFLSYFPYGIAVEDGGSDSTFRDYNKTPIEVCHAVEFDKPRLYCMYLRGEYDLILPLCSLKKILESTREA
jgi:hypothetical protein